MKRKTPKIEWEAKTETVDDIQYSYVAKSVTYARDCNVCLFVGRKTAEPTPLKFTYYLELDIDPEKDMSIWFRITRYILGHRVGDFLFIEIKATENC